MTTMPVTGTAAARPDAILERRYRRLLLSYPPEYRASRGNEIVATLLDVAEPGRRTPRVAEAADLVAAGLRQRLGVAAIAGFDAGLVVAAPVALALAAGISAFAWWRVEPLPPGADPAGSALFGQFRTLGPLAYAAWLIAAAGWATLRPVLSRRLIAVAIAVSALLPLADGVAGVDRPPLWVLMALSVFGVIAYTGTSSAAGARAAPSADERLGVISGAGAVAVCAWTATLAWPPADGRWSYYYQPTVSRVGAAVAIAVGAVAVVAVVRLFRGASTREWLWATVLLALPGGWLGPFDPGALPRFGAGQLSVPHFGRLAQILLASCVAAAAMAWLAQPRTPGAGRSRAPALPALGTAGAVAFGCCAGLVGFGLATRWALVGLASPHPIGEVPGYVVTGAAILAGVALLALAGTVGLLDRRSLRPLLAIAGAAAGTSAAAALLVGAYDNHWSVHGWADFGRTAAMVSTLVVVPLSVCAATAARLLYAGEPPRRTRRSAWGVLVGSAGWLGYVTLPYLFSWGPVLLVLLAYLGALALAAAARRRSATGPGRTTHRADGRRSDRSSG